MERSNGGIDGVYVVDFGGGIKVDVGDNVQVQLTNNTPLGTDIHWHGIHTPNDQDGVSPYTQDPIATGETFTYEFKILNAATHWYHPHFMTNEQIDRLREEEPE